MFIDTVLLKVASRCNLDCSYCYVYNMGDEAWRAAVEDEQIETDVHRIVAWRWNRHVLTASRAVDEPEAAYLDYLVGVSDRLLALWDDGLRRRADWPALRHLWFKALTRGDSPFLSSADELAELRPWWPNILAVAHAVESSLSDERVWR